MSALPEVSQHTADTGRQLNSPRVVCITRNEGWSGFYLKLVFPVWSRHSSN